MTVVVGLMSIVLAYVCRNVTLLHWRVTELEKRIAEEKKLRTIQNAFEAVMMEKE